MKALKKLILLLSAVFMLQTANAVPIAIDAEIREGVSAVYILYDDGFIVTAGKAVDFGRPSNIKAVDMTLTASGNGYYILEDNGTVHTFGDAVLYGQPGASDFSFTKMALPVDDSTKGYYLLREDGQVQTIGDTRFYGETFRSGAVDIELSQDGEGYYVLYNDGLIAFFGTAVNRGYVQGSSNPAVDLELQEQGYYVLYQDGTIEFFGKINPVPSQLPVSDRYVDLTMTSRGYQVLSEDGEMQTYFRLNNQGRITWFAEAKPRKVQPQQTPTPEPTPTPTVTPRPGTPYFDFNISGFEARQIAQLPEGFQVPPSITTGQTSLAGGGTYIVISDGEAPARKIHFFSAEGFDDSDFEGELFAELVPERGAAEIRGISFSQMGMMVLLKEEGRYMLFVIEGEYESSAILDFMKH